MSPKLPKSVGAGTFFYSYKKNFEFGFLKRVKIVFMPNPSTKKRHRSLLCVIIGVNTSFDDCFHVVCNSKSLTSSPCRLFVTHDREYWIVRIYVNFATPCKRGGEGVRKVLGFVWIRFRIALDSLRTSFRNIREH